MHKGPAFSLVATAYATGRGPVFQAGQQFQISVDDFLDEAEVEYSSSQVTKDKEIDTYTCFCDVMQLLEERFKYILEKKNIRENPSARPYQPRFHATCSQFSLFLHKVYDNIICFLLLLSYFVCTGILIKFFFFADTALQ